MSNPKQTTGVILAGGLATRMDGQDKALVQYYGQPLIQYAINALKPVVTHIIINANRNIDLYQHFGLPIIRDNSDHFDGPLAGVLAAMQSTDTEILLVMPCDSPLINTDHLQKLLTTLLASKADIAVAFDGQRQHNVLFAVRTSLKHSLQTYLVEGQRKVGDWQKQQHTLQVDFSQQTDMFTNLNTLGELLNLEAQQAQQVHK